MRLIPRAVALASAGLLTLSLLPANTAAAEEESAISSDQVVNETVDGQSETLHYEDGSTFTSEEIMSGEFTWEAEFDRGVYSREYTAQDSGTHSVHVDNITECAANDSPRIRLDRRNALGVWTAVDTKNVDCSGGVAVFTVFDPGEFRWHLVLNSSSGDEFGRYASGRTVYP